MKWTQIFVLFIFSLSKINLQLLFLKFINKILLLDVIKQISVHIKYNYYFSFMLLMYVLTSNINQELLKSCSWSKSCNWILSNRYNQKTYFQPLFKYIKIVNVYAFKKKKKKSLPFFLVFIFTCQNIVSEKIQNFWVSSLIPFVYLLPFIFPNDFFIFWG